MIFIFYLLTIVFLCFSAKKTDVNNKQSIFLKQDSNILKGFSAIIVVLHHIALTLNLKHYDVCNITVKSGGIAVGIFFMLSAYGLFKSYQKDENYYKKLLFIKIPVLYAYQVFVNFLYYLLFFLKKPLSTVETLIRIFNFDIFFGYERLNSYSWFITTILILYILVAVMMFITKQFKTHIKNSKLFILISIIAITTLLNIVIKLNGISLLYVRSIYCFVLGTIAILYEEKIINFLKERKTFLVTLIISICLVIICAIAFGEKEISLAICLLFISISSKISYHGFLYNFLGKISLEVYLIQLVFFNLINFNNVFLKSIAIISATIACAYLLHLLKYIAGICIKKLFFSKNTEKTN